MFTGSPKFSASGTVWNSTLFSSLSLKWYVKWPFKCVPGIKLKQAFSVSVASIASQTVTVFAGEMGQ
jgi:hypothetical protein